MKEIESEFQSVADVVVAGPTLAFTDGQRRSINNFFSLWFHRAEHRRLDEQEIQMSSITGADWRRDQEETFEKSGISFARPGGKFLARQMNGIQIQMETYNYSNDHLQKLIWGTIRSEDGEILVPDYPAYHIIPLTPRLFNATY